MNRFFLTRWSNADALSRPRRRAFRREIRWTWAAFGLTLAAITGFAVETVIRLHGLGTEGRWTTIPGTLMGRSLLGFFLLSSLVYLFTRLGYLARFARHRPIPDAVLQRTFEGEAPSLVILVPSYMEEPPVIRQTLLAAALQQSPNRRVVLLIDDPPAPRDTAAAARLAEARRLPGEIEAILAWPRRRCEEALAEFLDRRSSGRVDPRAEARRLAALWDEAAAWLDSLAAGSGSGSHHYDALFAERILRAPARSHRRRAESWRRVTDPGIGDLHAEYRRLAALFEAELSSFERKRYANLSHEPNKAMNLNAYLGLLGRGFREVESAAGTLLDPAGAGEEASLRVPDADFVIVLDADSVILPEYSLRLVHFMTRPGNDRVAVVQTPYAAVPGAPSPIESVAGSTTDVQLMSHQGATSFEAGSWVGASALVRRAALEEIELIHREQGIPVAVYIRDRTLTEDTDTTVALIRKGWTVHNYPARLAYSATPPDFGSLLIQRRRWATGGLIILADLWRYVRERPTRARIVEALIRAQYILAAPVGSIGLVVLMVYPFAPETLWSWWTLPGLCAYLGVYGRDVLHNGGRPADLFRSMALTAMLLPINLAGALNSIGQLCTRRKLPFQRTPKVNGRTAAAPVHVAAQIGLLVFACVQVPASLAAGAWLGAFFYCFYAICFAYALHVFIGWDAAFEDLIGGLYRPARRWLSRLHAHRSTADRKAA